MASHTDYTKPWLAEIHLTDQPLPHPVLRHEMVHAVGIGARPWAASPPGAWAAPPLPGPGRGAGGGAGQLPGAARPSTSGRGPRATAVSPPTSCGSSVRAASGPRPPERAGTAAGSFLADLLGPPRPAPDRRRLPQRRHRGPPTTGRWRGAGGRVAALARPAATLARTWPAEAAARSDGGACSTGAARCESAARAAGGGRPPPPPDGRRRPATCTPARRCWAGPRTLWRREGGALGRSR